MMQSTLAPCRVGFLVALVGWSALAASADLPGPAGSIVGWGDDFDSTRAVRTNIPTGNDFVAVSAGSEHAVALCQDGSLVAWGRNLEGQTDVPAGNDFIDVQAGLTWSMALRSNGELVYWGTPTGNSPPVVDDVIRWGGNTLSTYVVLERGFIIHWGVTVNDAYPAVLGIHSIAGGFNGTALLGEDGFLIRSASGDLASHAPYGETLVELSGGVGSAIARTSTGEVKWWGADNGVIDEPTAVLVDWDFRGGLVLRADGSIRSLGALAPAPQGAYFTADLGGSTAYENYGLAITPEPVSLVGFLMFTVFIRRR